MAIKLYDLVAAEENRAFSPFCWRIRMALAHKNLEVEIIPWRLTEKEVLAFSNQDRVPVIVDGNKGDKVVSDSWKIANYLEETYPDKPSLFGSAEAKAQTMFIDSWNGSLLGVLVPIILYDVFENIDPKDKAYFRESRESFFGKPLEEFQDVTEEQINNFRTFLESLRNTISQQPFLAGETPNYADYLVFSTFQFARTMSPKQLLETSDPVYAWREKMLELFDGIGRKNLGFN
ncbi:MAG: glutathione S-transferase family protein [Okeania sp. SIO3I5]|uniref:glutathione S-transferase family protein n=1 Tax=Okeania sp. SIO3I5 TaxID=2607805 RepID=UPI0013BCCBF0|nr:glutathione S-transferase family protein [Okeania sp. SIO3I5]NEQ36199.1 glutathione S-transferase family protein [Okeania sp. SIO3I5]